MDGVVLTRHFENDDTWIEVEQAAPRATFATALLRGIRNGSQGLECTIDKIGIGAILRIRARNRTLVYELVSHDSGQAEYVGVWPD
jgi:hypothetical protein